MAGQPLWPMIPRARELLAYHGCGYLELALLLYRPLLAIYVAGALFCVWQCWLGQRDAKRIYPLVYERFTREGPRCVPFTLWRVDGHTVIGLYFAWTVLGCALVQLTITVVLVLLGAMVDRTPNPVSDPLRSICASVTITILFEKLVLRAWLLPLVVHLRLGPIQYLIELYFMSIYTVKAFAATGRFYFFCIGSFFRPHRCAFPAGSEQHAYAHAAFLSMVMRQVESDAEERLILLNKFKAKITLWGGKMRRSAVGKMVKATRDGDQPAQRRGSCFSSVFDSDRRGSLQSNSTNRRGSLIPWSRRGSVEVGVPAAKADPCPVTVISVEPVWPRAHTRWHGPELTQTVAGNFGLGAKVNNQMGHESWTRKGCMRRGSP